MATVGVRQLRNRLGEFLRRIANGERITITDRGRPVALLIPPEQSEEAARAMAMVRDGLARWGGGTPRGSRRPIKIRGKPISDTVLEDRR